MNDAECLYHGYLESVCFVNWKVVRILQNNYFIYIEKKKKPLKLIVVLFLMERWRLLISEIRCVDTNLLMSGLS